MSPALKTVPLGTVVATPGALQALAVAAENYFLYLARHANRDWGDIHPDDAKANDESLQTGRRIISAYTLKDGTRIWIITEADRSSTCVLLPEEY